MTEREMILELLKAAYNLTLHAANQAAIIEDGRSLEKECDSIAAQLQRLIDA